MLCFSLSVISFLLGFLPPNALCISISDRSFIRPQICGLIKLRSEIEIQSALGGRKPNKKLITLKEKQSMQDPLRGRKSKQERKETDRSFIRPQKHLPYSIGA
jgi:hypothetical protein